MRVRTYTTFTAKWLIPHLMHFRQRYPDIEVLITNAVPNVDFDRDAVDIAIQYGEGNWPGTESDLLFRDELEPVCSPQYLATHRDALNNPAVLLKGPLLFRITDAVIGMTGSNLQIWKLLQARPNA